MTGKKKIKNYSTEYSHVVPHHSTDSAIDCLTSQIGRDAVGLVVYGRSLKIWLSHPVYVWEGAECGVENKNQTKKKKRKKKKTTAQSIHMWSPNIVMTLTSTV